MLDELVRQCKIKGISKIIGIIIKVLKTRWFYYFMKNLALH